MASLFISTKTYLPKPSVNWVRRQRLLDKLSRAEESGFGLLLLSAMAGSGKSSLVIDWANQASRPVAWLTLDTRDNDPLMFWTYVIASVQRTQPGFAASLLERLIGSEPLHVQVQDIPTELINEFASRQGPLTLVLDEYQQIDAPVIHENIIFLIEHLPANLQIILSTRSDPPMPLSRWRARGLLTEIRAEDLRFRIEEVGEYFNQVLKFGLDLDDINHLSARTEGWAAGLQLAGISLQSRSDRKEFIHAFSATHQYILDYLISEVLTGLPAETQDFLEQTSILKTFNADLCREVTGKSDSAEIIADLNRDNLFIVSLDDNRTWYRYHQLFADILRVRLAKRSSEVRESLHHRAVVWYERNQLADDALGHALQLKDKNLAVEIVVRNWRRVTTERGFSLTLGWFDLLGEAQIRGHPLLSSAYAWTLWLMGRTTPILPYIESAEQTYLDWKARDLIPSGQAEYTAIPIQLTSLRALVAVRSEQLEDALRYADECLRLSDNSETPAFALAHMTRATALRELGDIQAAIESYEQSVKLENTTNRSSTGLIFYLGKLYQAQGRLLEAEQRYRDTIRRMSAQRNSPSVAILEIGLSGLMVELNQLDEGHRLLASGLSKGSETGYTDLLKNAGYIRARLCLAEHDRSGAVAILDETLTQVRTAGTPSTIAETRAVLAAYQAKNGQLAAAEQWLEQTEEPAFMKIGLSQSIRLLSRARVMIYLGQISQAVDLLEQFEGIAERGGNTGWQIEALILLACAHAKKKNQTAANQALTRALTLAERRGYIRLFLDEGEGLAQTLLAVYPSVSDLSLAHYAGQLLDAFKTSGEGEPERSKGKSGGLVEPLSQREIEVLRLLSQGLTNQEIAVSMVISLATVKTHVNHIFGKVGADNRVEAVNRAREIGIL